jgi:signal transduction histidine kinase
LRRLIEVGRSLVAELELDAVLERVLDVARELTGARYAALGVLDSSRRELADFITKGIDDGVRREIGDLPRGRGVLGLLVSDPTPVRLSEVGAHPSSYGFPPGHPPMHSFLGVPVLIRGEAWGNLYLTDKPGGEFDEADEQTVVVLADWAAIAIENARLYQGSEARRHELERSVSALQATMDIARVVGGETRVDRVLELIAKRSRALVEARALAILLQADDEFVVAATAGEIPAELTGARLPAAASLGDRVLKTGRPERVDDLSKALRFALDGIGLEATSGLFVPLTFRGQQVGVIEAFDRFDGPEFRVEDERLLLSAATSAATAVATAQSVERDQLRRSIQGAEEERKRWARELHDETLQGLGALRVLLSSTRRRGSGAEDLGEAIDQAVDQLDDEIANLRALITELRPAALDELGLRPALVVLVERAKTIHGLEVAAAIELGDEDASRTRLDGEIETAVYRVVQEALGNAARHAGATRVDIEVQMRDGEITLAVRDDGTGFDTTEPSAGFGLTGMRERVAIASGRIEVSSSTEGTTVRATLPARRAAA